MASGCAGLGRRRDPPARLIPRASESWFREARVLLLSYGPTAVESYGTVSQCQTVRTVSDFRVRTSDFESLAPAPSRGSRSDGPQARLVQVTRDYDSEFRVRARTAARPGITEPIE